MNKEFESPVVVVREGDYRVESIERYRGNPYIEALPALPSDEVLQRALSNLPRFDPRCRQDSSEDRIQSLDLLQKLYIALPRHVRLARAMMKMLRTGYSARAPYSKQSNQRLQELYAQQLKGNFFSLGQTKEAAQHSFSLMGASGCGKSFTLRHVGGMFAPCLFHDKYAMWQLPFIFVEMAYDGESVHSLASGIFAELDRLLPGENYSKVFMETKRLNALQRLAVAARIAREHGVGMVIVDEQQNQRSIGNDWEDKDPATKRVTRRRQHGATNIPRNETPLTKLLITASNTTQIPLMMAGTLEMKSVVGSRYTRARRMSGRGSAVWHPLEPTFDLERPGEYELFLMALWPYQWIRNPVKLDDNWLNAFWDLTQGIPDIIVKLFESAQEAAIASGKETLTPSLVAEIFAKEFAAARFGIQALAEDDPLLLEAVPDLHNKNLPRPKVVKPGARAAAALDAQAANSRIPRGTGHAGNRASPTPMELPTEALKAADLRSAVLNGVSPVGVERKNK